MTYDNRANKQRAYDYGWTAILSHFGIDDACLDSRKGKRSYCPICGGDKHSNHFDFNNESPDRAYHCYSCSDGGDGFKLIFKFNGTTFGQVMKLVNGNTATPIAPIAPTTPIKQNRISEKAELAKKEQKLKEIINGASETPTEWGLNYLSSRGIYFSRSNDFLLYGRTPYIFGVKPLQNCLFFKVGGYGDDQPRGVVRTYADMPTIKKQLEAKGINTKKIAKKPFLSAGGLSGCGVWFNKTVNDVLHVGEGVENTLSVLQSLRTRQGVASVTAGQMAKLAIPSHVAEMHIWEDNGEVGQKGALSLKARYDAVMDVVIHTPQKGDWNDVLLADGESAIREEFLASRP